MTTAKATQRSIEGRSKRFKEVFKKVDENKTYTVEEASKLVKQVATAKFDETVELHFKTAGDPKHADQLIRGIASLPHGTGKVVRVMVFTSGEAAMAAREAGADYVADEEMIQRIDKEGWTDFDVAIATPDMMGRIGRLGRVLGRKGLMPNPRTGTVVQAPDMARAVKEAKGGRVEFRTDRTSILHVVIGKASFEPQQIQENLTSAVDAINKARPSGIKGNYLLSAYLTTTMGPSIRLDPAALTELHAE